MDFFLICPNCQKKLKPFKHRDTIEYYCEDIQDCQYATIANNPFRPDPFAFAEEDRDYPGKPKPKNDITNERISGIKKPEKYEIKLYNIIGYDGIKRKLNEVINHKGRKKVHTLIVGAPGTSKTVFLKSLENELIPQGCNFHYVDAATMTKRGLLDYIFDNDDIEILAIDEIDKVDKEHQSVFLNMLETGSLQITIYKNIKRKEVKSMIIIATGNYLEKIIEPLRTRFLTFYLRDYTKEQYLTICINMLLKKYDYIDKELAEYIAIETYNRKSVV